MSIKFHFDDDALRDGETSEAGEENATAALRFCPSRIVGPSFFFFFSVSLPSV